MKTCARCRENKPFDDFPNDRSRRDGKFAYCKACNSKHSRAWVLANRERAAEYQQAYRADNADTRRAYARDYARRRRQVPEIRETMRNNVRVRRARLRGAGITVADIVARVNQCGPACAYCGGDYTDIDHVIPLSRGGSDEPRNLVPCCETCNSSKARRNWLRWFRSRSFYSPERERRIAALIEGDPATS